MEDKLTAADLALFLGQKCYFEMKGRDGAVSARNLGMTIDGDFISAFQNGCRHNCRPILRPLSDLTEDEARHLHTIVFGWEFAGLTSCVDWMFQSFQPSEIDRIGALAGHYPAWRYLLSIGIDLFGWIDSGLAIDKTKIEQI